MTTEATGQLSLSPERAVLAAMLLGQDAIDKARAHLSSNQFHNSQHGTIFDAICALRAKSVPVDLITLSEYLREHDRLEEVGGHHALAVLLEHSTTTANVEAHASLVAQAARARELVRIGRDLTHAASQANDPADLATSFADRLRNLSNSTSTRDGLLEAFGRSLAITSDDMPRPEPILGDGLITTGDFFLIAGQPGMGKSRLALELAVAMARQQPWLGIPTASRPLRVAYLALEFSNYHWVRRCVQIFGDGRLPEESKPLLDEFRSLPLAGPGGAFHWITRQQVPALDLAAPAWANALRLSIEAFGLDVVIVDALSRSMGSREETNEEFAALAARVDDLRYSTGCAIGLIHHEKKVDDRSKADRLSLIRGGTNLTAAVNTVVTCSKTGSGLRAVYFDKANYAKEPDPIHYEIPEEGGPTVILQAPEARSQKSLEDVWRFLTEHRGEILTANQVADALGTPLRSARRYLGKLEERGLRRIKRDHEGMGYRLDNDF